MLFVCGSGSMYSSPIKKDAKFGIDISGQIKSQYKKEDSKSKSDALEDAGSGPDFELSPIKFGVGIGMLSQRQSTNASKAESQPNPKGPLVKRDYLYLDTPLIFYNKREEGFGPVSYLIPKDSKVTPVPDYTQETIGLEFNPLDEPIADVGKS